MRSGIDSWLLRVSLVVVAVCAQLMLTGCCRCSGCDGCDKDDNPEEDASTTDTNTDTGSTTPLHQPSGWEPSTPTTGAENVSDLVSSEDRYWSDYHQSYLFHTGPDAALAVYSTGTRNVAVWEATTTDGGTTWGPNDDPGSIASSGLDFDGRGIFFREPSGGPPLVVPTHIDSWSEPMLFFWDQENSWWEHLSMGGCSELYLTGDAVLNTASEITYVACLVGDETQISKADDSGAIPDTAYLEPVDDVLLATQPELTGSGTLWVLMFTGGPNNDMTIREYAEEGMGTFTLDETTPVDALQAQCGDDCRVTSLVQYIVTGTTHHIFAKAELPYAELHTPPIPTMHDDRSALLHIHGSPGGTFTTEIVNMIDYGSTLTYLGRLLDVEISRDPADTLYVTLQDDACLRVLATSTDAVEWQPMGVVPTFIQPRENSILVWGEQDLGILAVTPGMDYMSFPVSSGEGACIPPEEIPNTPIEWDTVRNTVRIDRTRYYLDISVENITGAGNVICSAIWTTPVAELGCTSPGSPGSCPDDPPTYTDTQSIYDYCDQRVLQIVFDDQYELHPTVLLPPGPPEIVAEDGFGYPGSRVPTGEDLTVTWDPYFGEGTFLVEVAITSDPTTILLSEEVDDSSGTHTFARADLTGLVNIQVTLSRTQEHTYPFPVDEESYLRSHASWNTYLTLD